MITDELKEQFTFPDELLSQIYDLTGNGETDQGFILAMIGDDKNPKVYTRFDGQASSFAIRKSMEAFLKGLDNSEQEYDLQL